MFDFEREQPEEIYDSVGRIDSPGHHQAIDRSGGPDHRRIRRKEQPREHDDVEPSLLYIDISYAVKATNDRRNLVFPFYVIPEED